MQSMGYDHCKADPELWMKSRVQYNDGKGYHYYILCYVDDLLCTHNDNESFLLKLDKYFYLKHGSLEDPGIYMGAMFRPMKFHSDSVS